MTTTRAIAFGIGGNYGLYNTLAGARAEEKAAAAAGK